MANELAIDNGAIAQLFQGNDVYVLPPQGAVGGFPIVGSGTNGVAVVYNQTDGLGAEDQEQLYKILAALKLDTAAIALINLAQVPAPAFSNIVRQTQCQYLLVFGATPADMGMLVAAKRYVELNMQGARILFSDSLELLRQDPKRKRYLWDCLQVVFRLKP